VGNVYWYYGMSFIAGMFGYIIVKFWVLPIVKYKRLRQRLLSELGSYSEALPADAAAKMKSAPAKKRLRDMRRLGVKLISVHDGELPYWYRLMLMSRKESPAAATEPLLRLENMPTSGQARQCIETILGCLSARKLVAKLPDTKRATS
jgi:hypothetical protein